MTGVYTPAMSIFQSAVLYAFSGGFFRGWFQGLILLPLPALCSENQGISWGVCIWEASLMHTSQLIVLILRLIPGFFRVRGVAGEHLAYPGGTPGVPRGGAGEAPGRLWETPGSLWGDSGRRKRGREHRETKEATDYIPNSRSTAPWRPLC